MSRSHNPDQPLLTFPDSEKSPLSIRAKALVFIDPRARRLREDMERLATLPQPVLIHGESGTGKELLARHIHRASERPGLFVSVNCGAISPSRAEAELFGYTAANQIGSPSSRAGWFGSANGGTLYLDEIGDLPLAMQDLLLAALENHEVTRVGAGQPTPVDVRLVAATSLDLAQAVAAGKFNARLHHYLAAGHLQLPALREQPGNILPLAEYFLGIHSQRLDLPVPAIGDAARSLLEAYDWPGNTRELENVVHFALLVCEGGEIAPHHLDPSVHADPLVSLEQRIGRLALAARRDELNTVRRRLEQLLAQVDAAN